MARKITVTPITVTPPDPKPLLVNVQVERTEPETIVVYPQVEPVKVKTLHIPVKIVSDRE